MLTSAGALDWLVFAGVVLATLALDVALFGRSGHYMSFREATARSAMFVIVGLGFTGWVYARLGRDDGIAYVVAYLVEESLSVDNLFVFLVIFTYFRINELQQQRVLFWGIAGAIIMRGIFVGAGTVLLSRFHWMMYVFGAFLVFTGVKLALKKNEGVDPEASLPVRLARRYLRTTDRLEGSHFFVRQEGKTFATPLFLVLLVVEFTDVLFAVDSVPAVLAISRDVFVVYTSNVFAILGLRALYFMLAGMMSRFVYLDIGLSIILVFIGAKMLLADVYKVPNLASLAVIAVVLSGAIAASLMRPARRSSLPGG